MVDSDHIGEHSRSDLQTLTISEGLQCFSFWKITPDWYLVLAHLAPDILCFCVSVLLTYTTMYFEVRMIHKLKQFSLFCHGEMSEKKTPTYSKKGIDLYSIQS